MSSGGNIQGVAHLQNQNYLVTESLNVSFKRKRMVMKIPIIVTTITRKKEIVKGAHNDTQHQNSAHPNASPIDCDWVQLTNAQCHMVPYPCYDIENPELYNRNIHLKPSKQEKQYHIIQHTITATPTFWYVCLLERAYFKNMCSYNICYAYGSYMATVSKETRDLFQYEDCLPDIGISIKRWLDSLIFLMRMHRLDRRHDDI